MFLRNSLFVLGLLTLLSGLTLAVLWMRLPATVPQASPQVVSEEASPQAAAQPYVLVATQDVPQGTLLRPEQMAWKAVPQAQILPNWIVRNGASANEYVGAVTRRGFAAGEALVSSGIVKSTDRNFLAAVLAPGMRAVSLSVDTAQAAAGLIEPGDHVDIILAETLNNQPTARSSVGSTVLGNMRVVAVDQWFAGNPKPTAAGGALQSSGPKTITLEATEEDATRLLVASQLGRVTMALRALDGNYIAPAEIAETKTAVWAGDVSPAYAAAPKTGRRAVSAGIRILRGSGGATR